MPLWKHNVAYEEGDESVTSLFKTGYPRFFMHPSVVRLTAGLAGHHDVSVERALVLPTLQAGNRCADYVLRRTGTTAEVHDADVGVTLVLVLD